MRACSAAGLLQAYCLPVELNFVFCLLEQTNQWKIIFITENSIAAIAAVIVGIRYLVKKKKIHNRPEEGKFLLCLVKSSI